MTRRDGGTPSELRELATERRKKAGWALEATGMAKSGYAPRKAELAEWVIELSDGLLSTLDALEAANKERAEALTDATNVRVNLSMTHGMVVGTESLLADAEASRDQAIKERDRLRKTCEDVIRFVRTGGTLGKADREELIAFVLADLSALAGVPGGSPEEHPEEHNPGGTAVAVPSSESEEV